MYPSALVYVVGRSKSKWALRGGVKVAALQLGVFHYFNFFTSILFQFFGTSANIINILIPLGVLFYTFSAISYMIDVHKGKYEGKRILDVALYISFFPKLTSGSIVRVDKFFTQ